MAVLSWGNFCLVINLETFSKSKKNEGIGGLRSYEMQVVFLKRKMIAVRATPGEQCLAADFC